MKNLIFRERHFPINTKVANYIALYHYFSALGTAKTEIKDTHSSIPNRRYFFTLSGLRATKSFHDLKAGADLGRCDS